MKKLVPLFMCSLLSVSSVFTPILAEGEDDTDEISEESEEKAVDETYTGLRILFTNDLQDHVLPYKKAQDNGEVKTVGGYARLATAINTYKTEDSLLIDGGDFSTGTTFNALYESDAPDLTLMGMLGYDAVALGEKDFSYGVDTFTTMLSIANDAPTIITGNLEYQESAVGRTARASIRHFGGSEYKILEKAGLKVGIFPIVEETNVEEITANVDYRKYAKETVESLQTQGCDYIIAIAHGTTHSIDFAKEIADVEGIDTVLSSCEVDEITTLDNAETNIISAGENGDYLGVLDINPNTKAVDDYQLVSIDEAFENNETISNKVNEYNDKINGLLFSSYELGKDTSSAQNNYNFTSIDHYSSDLINNNTADLITDSYSYAYDEWYSEWYTEWKANRRQMLKAAQSLANKEDEAQAAEEAANQEETTEEAPVEETTEETVDPEATPESTPEVELTEAEQRVEDISNMTPDIKKVAIGLVSKKEIQGTFTKDSITATDAFNAVPGGVGSDGSIGESLILVFMKGSDLRTLCEYDVTVTRSDIEENGNQLFFSGLKYTYDDFRGDYNHVEEVYVDAVNGYYIPVKNNELYPVVTTYSLAKELLDLKTGSNLDRITYYDENGGLIQSLSSHILTYEKKEMKSYKAICDYVNQLERNKNGNSEIPSDYEIANVTKTCNTEFSLISYFKNPTAAVFKGYVRTALGIGLIIVVIIAITIFVKKKIENRELEEEINNKVEGNDNE